MANNRRPLAIDWYLFVARWPVLIAVLLVHLLIPLANNIPHLIYTVLIVGVALNLIYFILLFSEQYTSTLATFAQVIDVVLLLTILYATGKGDSPLFVLAALPVVGGTLRFGSFAGFITALFLAGGYGGMILSTFGQTPPQPVLILYALITLLLFLLAGIPSQFDLIPEAKSSKSKSKEYDLEITELRDANERLKTVYELTNMLSATLSYERVLDALLETSAMGLEELSGNDVPRMVFLYSSKGILHIAASRNLRAGDQNLTVSDQTGILQQTLKNAEPSISDNVAADPELSKFSSLENAKSLLCVPLRAGFEVYGAVLLASLKSEAFTEKHIELISSVCNQAVIALQNARLYQNLQDDRQRIIDTQEEIRRQLARELHDGPTQSVSAIAMRLNFTKILVTREPQRAAIELEKLEELARRTAKEIRTMLFTLRPLALETQGLTAALEQYAEKLKETEGLEVHVNSELDERLSSKTEGIAFSIIEEAVNNARKHARANNIYVRLRLQQDLLVAEVEDDGRGFDLSSVDRSYDQRGSLGLVNMRERAALVSGSLTIKSEPGKGTLITLLVPLSEINRGAR